MAKRDQILFRGSNFVVQNAQHDLPRNEHFPFGSTYKPAVNGFIRGRTPYYQIRDRSVRFAWLHHTGGNTSRHGFKGPLATAGYAIQEPRIVGGYPDFSTGRGWPGMPYHLFIPFKPVEHKDEKLPVIYQCWDPSWVVWHTKGKNKTGYGIVCQGSFKREPGSLGDKGQPSVAQFEILQAAWREWIKPLLGIDDRALYAHADASKPSCPGGTLHDWVLGKREKRTIRQLEARA